MNEKDKNGLVKTGEYTAVNPNFQAPINPRVTAINAEIAAQGNKGYSVAPGTTDSQGKLVAGSQPITSDTLSNSTPLVVPDLQPQTLASGINAGAVAQGKSAAQSALDEYNRALKESELKATSKASEQESKVRTIFNNIMGIQAEKSQAEKDAGIPQLNEKVKEIAQRIEDTDKARVAELAALEGQNMTATGSLAAQAGINRKYALQQLAQNIELDAQTGRLDRLQSTIDKNIELKLEPLKMQYELETKFLERNWDALGSSEQRIFEAKKSETERLLNQESDNLKSIGEFAKQVAANGADPSTVVKVANAKTMAEAVQAAGQFAGDVLERQKKQLEIQKLNKEIQSLGVPTITNPQAGKYAGALNILLGSGTFTKDQKATLINAVNNGQDPFSVIKNQAKNIMGQTNATKLDNYETAKQQLVDVQSALDQYYNLGGDTSLLKGSYEKVINKLGEVNDPDLVEIATQIQSALQIYRNAVSGTAYSVQEGADIASIFPGISKSKGLNKAVLNGRMAAFDSTIDTTYKNVLGDTYSTLKQAETAQKVKDVGIPKVIPQTQIPEGYYQASDGLFYKKQ